MSETLNLVNNKKFYYPSLDGLRFLAFFIVFLHHALVGISTNNIYLEPLLSTIQKNGWIGVDLFFVLSGFLITRLLLSEKQKYNSISLKKFWIRRALRIWPLYYLALFFGFIIEPILYQNLFQEGYQTIAQQNELTNKSIFYILFLGNWAVSLTGYSSFQNISHLWTISLEEQFYFIWPIALLFLVNFRRALIACVLIIFSSIMVRFFLSINNIQHPGIYTNTLARIDTLAIGAVLALIIFFKPNLESKIKKITSSLIFFPILLIFLMFMYKLYFFDPRLITNITFGYLAIAVFMCYLLLVSLYNNSINLLLSFKPVVLFGKISYGLYVWHIFAIDLSRFLLKNSSNHFLVTLTAFLITVLLGLISYYFFEIYFLKLKQKYTLINSRPAI